MNYADIILDYMDENASGDWTWGSDDDARAALDALVAERDALLADSIADRLGFDERLGAAEAEVARLRGVMDEVRWQYVGTLNHVQEGLDPQRALYIRVAALAPSATGGSERMKA
jgi:hypothetical protein